MSSSTASSSHQGELPSRDGPDSAHFAAALCRNCGSPLQTPFCPWCGQKRVGRLASWHLGEEIWNKVKLFDATVVAATRRVVRAPGTVAREYIYGARKRNLHPIKLLLVAIGLLLLVVQRGNYLASANAPVSSALAIVQAWGNLSFSLGTVAIVAASWMFYRRYGGFNFFEHVVLSCYIQFLILVVSVMTKLPTLIWTNPAFHTQHRFVSTWLLNGAGLLIFMIACQQFFLIDLRRGWMRLLCAGLVFLCIKWLLVRLYAALLIHLVLTRA